MIKRKLRSEKGASITFALLIFLVCAVISSVVLVAATAASGRISRQAETDQRYYSVTSAAELLKEIMEEGPVQIVRKTVSTSKTSYSETGELSTETTTGDTLITIKSTGDTGILYEAANAYDKYHHKAKDTSVNQYATLDVSLTTNITDANNALDVTIKESLDKSSGDIVFELYNTYNLAGPTPTPSAAGSQYKLKMTFPADVKTRTMTKTEEGSPVPAPTAGDDSQYTVTTTTTTITTTTISWKLSSTSTP